ncbi:MAG: hypothetical protein ABI647_07780 [Gemmatimonadota bacterium]
MTTAAPGTLPRPHSPAIISPVIDLLCVGGLSILLFVPLLVFGGTNLAVFSPAVQGWIGVFLNMPHFMASYRMIYRSRDTIRAHRWAAIYVPILLIAYMAFAVAVSDRHDEWLSALFIVQGVYLAWHYTGQAWGMVVTFTRIEGAPLAPIERTLIQWGLRTLTLWQVVWFLHWRLWNGSTVSLFEIVTVAMAIPLAMGAIGFALYRGRTGRNPPLKSLVAWISVFVWYGVLFRDPNAQFLVQNAHALQYLIFPVRVEINRTTRAAPKRGRLLTHMAAYGALLLAASFVWDRYLPGGAMTLVAHWLGQGPGVYAGLAVLTFLNIHHFFTDGVAWKLRNPEVREDLFGHLEGGKAAGRQGGKLARS